MYNTFSPSPLMTSIQSPVQMYGHGGYAHPYHMSHGHHGHHYPYHHEASMLQHMGMGRDHILAHINPAEASYLHHHHGMSINPHTGLPQFGLFDTLKTGLRGLGSAAMSAAPGIWEQYGKPLAQQGLQALDTRIQGALPGLAQSFGQTIGGERGGALGQSFGQNLAKQYGNVGGLTGQVIPRIDTRFGLEGNQAPSINPRQAALDIGKGVWGDVGRGMVRQGLQNVDERVMGALPGLGSRAGGAIGGRFGMGERGAMLGANVGQGLASRYGETSGIGGQVMPKLNQAVQGFGNPAIPSAPPPPPMPMNMRPTGPGPQTQIAAMGPTFGHGGHHPYMHHMYPMHHYHPYHHHYQ